MLPTESAQEYKAMPIDKISTGLKVLWIIGCTIFGTIGGAILIGGLSSIPLTILGGVLGLVLGFLAGRYIPWYEWLIR